MRRILSFLMLVIPAFAPGLAWAASVDVGSLTCEKCSRFVEINSLKARCFKKRFEQQGLLQQFDEQGTESILVRLNCGLRQRDIVTAPRATENDPDSHVMTKAAIQCLYDMVVASPDNFSPSRLVNLEKACVDG